MAQRSSKRNRKSARKAPRGGSGRSGAAQMVFGQRNYVLLLGSIGLVALGYILMAADNARGVDAQGVHFSLDSTLSLVIAPLLLLAGYLGLVGAILWRPKEKEEQAVRETEAAT